MFNLEVSTNNFQLVQAVIRHINDRQYSILHTVTQNTVSFAPLLSLQAYWVVVIVATLLPVPYLCKQDVDLMCPPQCPTKAFERYSWVYSNYGYIVWQSDYPLFPLCQAMTSSILYVAFFMLGLNGFLNCIASSLFRIMTALGDCFLLKCDPF